MILTIAALRENRKTITAIVIKLSESISLIADLRPEGRIANEMQVK